MPEQLKLTFPGFGTPASQPAQSGGLFGSTSQPAQSGGLFGSTSQPAQSGGSFGSTSQPTQSGGLFGSTSQPAQSGGLFGSTSQPAQSGGLFGSTSQPAQGGSLFGSTTQPAQTGGLFGSTSQPAASGGLFGASTSQTSQPTQTGGLFGGTTLGGGFGSGTQPSGSLFGSTAAKPSLFGSTTTQQPQQGGGLFGNSTQQQQPQQISNWGSSTQQQQQQQQPPAARSIWQPNASLQPHTKSIPEQIATLLSKWNPDSPQCVFTHYFYNSVPEDSVPYYHPSPGEDEAKWEEALAAKPTPGSIPALARGFAQMAERITLANKAVQGLQMRMHEINNSLVKNLEKHELESTIRAGDARRRHAALSKRCLALATKVQVLRNRGYAMDGAEEVLRQKLQVLEKKALDPVLSGRQEEIWARLSDLRERAEMLREERDRLGKTAKAENEELDDETKKMIQKLLMDYDSQLVHLGKELEAIKGDFAGWEGDQVPGRGKSIA